MPVRKSQSEDGFTMIATVIGLSLVAMLVLVAVTAVNGDSHLTAHDLQQKQAFEAAKAGIDDYAYHLHANNSYWTACDKAVMAPGEKSAVNLQGSVANKRPVPGGTGAEYAIELLPSTSQTKYKQCNTENPTLSMLESKDPLKGTFRVRSTGFVGNVKTSIVATFKPASFLDYVYFTQFETSDPVTYSSELIVPAKTRCSKTVAEGRYSAEIVTGKGYCDAIVFAGNDHINGPMHTNDAFAICQSPYLGRDAADPVEVSSPPKGWYSTSEIVPSGSGNCVGTNKNFLGTFTANSPKLTPPATNSELKNIADPKYKYKGQVRICLSGGNMTVMTYTETTTCSSPPPTPLYSGAIPPNGVVYVEAMTAGGCSTAYSPFHVSYKLNPETIGCGDAFVQGTYSGQLTIAAENNIVITESLCLESCKATLPLQGTGVLGLVANNFVRIYHPVKNWSATGESSEPHKCENATGTMENVVIDAAMLAIEHSIIVDDYDCGARLSNLTVNGALAQKYRGAVGRSGTPGRGYTKDYNYDNRLRYLEPPSFIEPEKSSWVIGRETLE